MSSEMKSPHSVVTLLPLASSSFQVFYILLLEVLLERSCVCTPYECFAVPLGPGEK